MFQLSPLFKLKQKNVARGNFFQLIIQASANERVSSTDMLLVVFWLHAGNNVGVTDLNLDFSTVPSALTVALNQDLPHCLGWNRVVFKYAMYMCE